MSVVPDQVTSEPVSHDLSAGNSLKRRAMETSVWTMGGFGLRSAFRLGSNIVLARLLVPEDFGIIAVAFVIQTGLEMFSDVGLNQNAIQSKCGDDRSFLETLWTIQILRGCFIAVGLWFIAATFAFTNLQAIFPESSAYRAPEMPGLIALIALISILNGFSPTKAITASRHMQIGRLTAIQLSAQVLGSFVTIAAALLNPTVWAFAIGALFGALAELLLKTRALTGPPDRLHFNSTHAHDIYSFGKWIFLSSILGFFVTNAPILFFSLILVKEDLGFFSIALTLSAVCAQLAQRPTATVLFPLLSEKNRLFGHSALNYSYKYILLFLFSFFLIFFLFIISKDLIVLILYDDRYSRVSYYCGVTSLIILNSSLFIWQEYMKSIGKSKFIFFSSLGSFSFLIFLYIIFYYTENNFTFYFIFMNQTPQAAIALLYFYKTKNFFGKSILFLHITSLLLSYTAVLYLI